MKKKISPAELAAIMRPENSKDTDGPWAELLGKAEARHKGESIKRMELSDATENAMENLGPDLSIKSPEDPRVFETPLIRVSSNSTGDDYHLNVEPRHPKRPWAHDPATIAMQIASRLDEVIPRTMEVIVRPPQEDWEIMLYTFTVKGLNSHWSISQARLAEVEKKISHELQAYC